MNGTVRTGPYSSWVCASPWGGTKHRHVSPINAAWHCGQFEKALFVLLTRPA
jgi:hypothetical protein